MIIAVLVLALGGVVALAASGGGGSSAAGWQMMGGRYVYRRATSSSVRTLAAARSDAQQFASRLGLRVDEVLQFERNFYAKLVGGKGNGATEVLVAPASGLVSIEYGPAMIWNTRYGMMGSYAASMMGRYGSYAGMTRGYGTGSTSTSGYGAGTMMGGHGSSTTQIPAAPSTSATVSLASAHTLAQRWLDANERSVTVERGGGCVPGYYTLETLMGGKITGMISVNPATGAVWPHWWHGAFIGKSR